MWNGTMFVDLDWPLNASSPLSASAGLLVLTSSRRYKILRTPSPGALYSYAHAVWRKTTTFSVVLETWKHASFNVASWSGEKCSTGRLSSPVTALAPTRLLLVSKVCALHRALPVRNITSPKEVMFSLCLFVCLFVSRISHKLLNRKAVHGPKKNA